MKRLIPATIAIVFWALALTACSKGQPPAQSSQTAEQSTSEVAPTGPIAYSAPQALVQGSQAAMPAPRTKTGPIQVAFLPPASTLNFYRPVGAGVRAVAEGQGAVV